MTVKSRLTRQDVLDLIESAVSVDAGILAPDEILLQELLAQFVKKDIVISWHALRNRVEMLEKKRLVRTRMILANGRRRMAIKIVSPVDFQAYLRELVKKKQH